MVPLKAATPCRPARQLGSGLPACFASLSAGRQTPDGGFVLQTTTLEFRDATENVLASWPYSPALFVQDPNDPLRRILDTSFTPPSGVTGASGLHLRFLATAQVTDPVSEQPETVEASAEAPVSVKPAVSPLLSLSFTGPATLEAGASGTLAIEIRTSDPANASATFCVHCRGDRPVAPTPIDLSGFQVTGNTMTGRCTFTAPGTAGLYTIVVSAARREGEPPGEPVETASAQSPLTVTPASEPEPWLDITTPSPIVAVEGSEVSADFAIGPPTIRPLITGIKWKVLDGATLLFSGLVAPASLLLQGDRLVGHLSFIVPKGIVSAPTDLTLQVVAEIAGNLVSDFCVLRVSPAPEEPIALSIYSVPEPPVFETETVEYRFLMTPPEIFPNLLGGTFAVVERDTGNPLFVQNIDLATLTVNSHITGAAPLEVPVGTASAGGGALSLVVTFWTGEQTASAAVPLDVLAKPSLELVAPGPPVFTEETEALLDFRLRPGEAVVEALRWELTGASGTVVIADGVISPETLRHENGYWAGTIAVLAPAGSAAVAEPVLSIEAVIAGFPVPVSFSTPAEVRPRASFRIVMMNEEPLALREYRPYPFYVKLSGVSSPGELDEITLRLFCGDSAVAEMVLHPSWLRPSGAAFFGVFELVVPKGTGGLAATARVTARKGEAVAQDAKAGQISAFPPGQVASLVLQSSRYFTVPLYSRSAPVRYVALDIDGNPVSGATIRSWIYPNPDAGTIVPTSVVTGPQGEFQFEIETDGVPCNQTVASVGLPPLDGQPNPPPGEPVPTRQPGVTPAMEGQAVPAPAYVIMKVTVSLQGIETFLGAGAQPVAATVLMHGVQQLHRLAEQGHGDLFRARFAQFEASVRHYVGLGALSLESARHLMCLLLNEPAISQFLSKADVSDDLKPEDTPCIQVCLPWWQWLNLPGGPAHDFMKIEYRQPQEGDVPPVIVDVPVLRIGDFILLTVPNSDTDLLTTGCDGIPPRSYDSTEGDLPGYDWSDLPQNQGRLTYDVLRAGPPRLTGPLALYEPPFPDKPASPNPPVPDPVTVAATVYDNPKQHSDGQGGASVTFTVVGVDGAAPSIQTKDGKISKQFAPGDEIVCEASTKPAGDAYERMIVWTLDGSAVGRGKRIRLKVYQEGRHFVQAWVGMSRTNAEAGGFSVGDSQRPVVDIARAEGAFFQALLDARTAAVDELKQYIHDQGPQWKKYLPNSFYVIGLYGQHDYPCAAFPAFINRTEDEEGNIYEGPIRGWLHGPQGYRTETGITMPLNATARLHSPAIDMDVLHYVMCDCKGERYPEDPKTKEIKKQHRFGGIVVREWTPPGNWNLIDPGSDSPALQSPREKEAAGRHVVRCGFSNTADCGLRDNPLTLELAVNVFRPDLVPAGPGWNGDRGETIVNDNDSDENGEPDIDQESLREPDPDLLRVDLAVVGGMPESGTFRLEWDPTYLRGWRTATKGASNRFPEAVKTAPDGKAMATLDFAPSELKEEPAFWLEGVSPTGKDKTTKLVATYIDAYGYTHPGDEVEVTIKGGRDIECLGGFTYGWWLEPVYAPVPSPTRGLSTQSPSETRAPSSDRLEVSLLRPHARMYMGPALKMAEEYWYASHALMDQPNYLVVETPRRVEALTFSLAAKSWRLTEAVFEQLAVQWNKERFQRFAWDMRIRDKLVWGKGTRQHAGGPFTGENVRSLIESGGIVFKDAKLDKRLYWIFLIPEGRSGSGVLKAPDMRDVRVTIVEQELRIDYFLNGAWAEAHGAGAHVPVWSRATCVPAGSALRVRVECRPDAPVVRSLLERGRRVAVMGAESPVPLYDFTSLTPPGPFQTEVEFTPPGSDFDLITEYDMEGAGKTVKGTSNKRWVIRCTVEITRLKGSLDANPNPATSWIPTPCYHFDFQGVTSGSPRTYNLLLQGTIAPVPPLSYGWTLDSTAGTLSNEATATPTHSAPATAGEGTLTLRAMYKGSAAGCNGERKVKIYTDHLDRDIENFGTGGSCGSFGGAWSFTRFNVKIDMTTGWNCHGSVKHAFDGSGTGSSDTTVTWTVKKTCGEGDPLGTLDRGDVIAYYDKNMTLMHSQTVVSGATTWGANNEPPPGDPGTQSWKWANSEAGKWAAGVPAAYKPITIKVLDRP